MQSCVKNVRDLFQALSRCGFTSVNPFTHRSSAVRLPHVTGSTGCLALPHRAGAVPMQDMMALSGPVLSEARTKHCIFHLILAADRPRSACSPVRNRLSLSKPLRCFHVAHLCCRPVSCTLIILRMVSVEGQGWEPLSWVWLILGELFQLMSAADLT